ncbi:MAG: FCD domain-containing protein [Nocardioides sp.]|uniref:FadR/GntR family transcriptional regulator n=1 Tax=Nocardioides sp. TaxID=35761 RepID=UPI0039E55F9D
MSATDHRVEVHPRLLDAVGEEIASGRLAPGTVVTLEGLVAAHGVSRSAAREAVRVLESMGMIASRRRVGLTVRPREEWHVFDPLLIRWRLESGDRSEQLVSLSELRRGFEPVAAALAAERADPEQCRALAVAASDMVTTGRRQDLEAYLAADQAFHRTLLEASGNEMMRALVPLVDAVLEGRTHHALMPSDPNPEAIELHDRVASAVRRGDPVAADAAMRAIIDETAAALRDSAGGERSRRLPTRGVSRNR